jgi:hypothetical protein
MSLAAIRAVPLAHAAACIAPSLIVLHWQGRRR